MIAKFKIAQGTQEWHIERYGKIGGTASKGLFVESDTLLDSILAEHLEPFEMDDDSYIGYDMQRGIELEPMAIQEVSVYAGIELLQCGWLQSSECSILGISPDGISKCLTVSAETKCPGKTKHTKTIRSGEIPLDNIHQCLHYFTVNPKLEKHYFASFRPESKYPLFVKCLTRDSIIDLGSKSKPNNKSVSEWVKIALDKALELESQLKIELIKLEQI
jgi:hypothetical protein